MKQQRMENMPPAFFFRSLTSRLWKAIPVRGASLLEVLFLAAPTALSGHRRRTILKKPIFRAKKLNRSLPTNRETRGMRTEILSLEPLTGLSDFI